MIKDDAGWDQLASSAGPPEEGSPKRTVAQTRFSNQNVNKSGVGCHDLGVCDKVVLNLDLSSFHNRTLLGLIEISLILMIHRRHGLVADSKTVAPIT